MGYVRDAGDDLGTTAHGAMDHLETAHFACIGTRRFSGSSLRFLKDVSASHSLHFQFLNSCSSLL